MKKYIFASALCAIAYAGTTGDIQKTPSALVYAIHSEAGSPSHSCVFTVSKGSPITHICIIASKPISITKIENNQNEPIKGIKVTQEWHATTDEYPCEVVNKGNNIESTSFKCESKNNPKTLVAIITGNKPITGEQIKEVKAAFAQLEANGGTMK